MDRKKCHYRTKYRGQKDCSNKCIRFTGKRSINWMMSGDCTLLRYDRVTIALLRIFRYPSCFHPTENHIHS